MSAEIQLKREPSVDVVTTPSKRKRQTGKTHKCCFARDAFQTLNEFRKKQFLCDFRIITGKTAHQVHRSVLMTRSLYFREYFIINPLHKEISLEESAEEGVRSCIEFMYTDNISVNLANVEKIFAVSLQFQLDEVSKICRDCFVDDLTVDNCLVIRRLAERFKVDLQTKFGIPDLEARAEKFAITNFQAVLGTEPFLKTPTKELIRLLSFEQQPVVIWDSLSRWVKFDLQTRQHELTNVLKSINLSKFSSQDLLVMANNLEFAASPGFEEFLGYEILKRQNSAPNAENWIVLRDLAIKFGHRDLREKVDKFVLENFSTITRTLNFCRIDKFTLMDYLKAIPITKSRELVIWEAIIKWTRSHEERKNCFTEIIRSIRLSHFSFEFIKNTVKNESLINQNNDCLKMVIEALCAKTR